MEATRKRLEALLQQLERATASADHTIGEVKAALREIDDARTASARRSPPPPKAKKRTPAGRAARKR